MRPNVIVFDLDGTLVDTAPDLTAALNHTLRALGMRPVQAEKVRHIAGDGAAALIRSAVPAARADEFVASGKPIFLDYYRSNICRGSRLFDEAERVLKELRLAGYRLAVCTNKTEELARTLVAELGVAQLFDAIVGGDTCGACKPAAEPFRRAVALAGGGGGVLVGDSIVDAETARAAGAPFVAVTFGFSNLPPDQLGADALIDRYADLARTLDRISLSS